MEDLNPSMVLQARAGEVEIKPDGDVELTEDEVLGFNVPPCSKYYLIKYKLAFRLDRSHNSVALVQSECPNRPVTILCQADTKQCSLLTQLTT